MEVEGHRSGVGYMQGSFVYIISHVVAYRFYKRPLVIYL